MPFNRVRDARQLECAYERVEEGNGGVQSSLCGGAKGEREGDFHAGLNGVGAVFF